MYHDLDVDPDSAPFGGDVIDLWQAKRDARGMPSWDDLAMPDFRAWIRYVCCDEVVEAEPIETVTRLWGSKMTALTGSDWTGTTLRKDSNCAA